MLLFTNPEIVRPAVVDFLFTNVIYEKPLKIKRREQILNMIVSHLNSNEVPELYDWINASSGNRAYHQQILNIWDAADHKLDIKNIDVEAAWEKVSKQISRDIKR